MARSTRRLNAEAARRSVAFPWHFRGVSCAARRVARRTRSLAARGGFSGTCLSPSPARIVARMYVIVSVVSLSSQINAHHATLIRLRLPCPRSVAWETSVRISLLPPPPPLCPLVCLCLVRLSCSTSSDRFPIVSSGDQRRPVVPVVPVVLAPRAHTRIVPLLERVRLPKKNRKSGGRERESTRETEYLGSRSLGSRTGERYRCHK